MAVAGMSISGSLCHSRVSSNNLWTSLLPILLPTQGHLLRHSRKTLPVQSFSGSKVLSLRSPCRVAYPFSCYSPKQPVYRHAEAPQCRTTLPPCHLWPISFINKSYCQHKSALLSIFMALQPHSGMGAEPVGLPTHITQCLQRVSAVLCGCYEVSTTSEWPPRPSHSVQHHPTMQVPSNSTRYAWLYKVVNMVC
jgi:hypothetical protein